MLKALIDPGDRCAGIGFLESVRTLIPEKIPQVSEPPGNSEEFQAHAVFLFRVKESPGFFNAYT
jgi:hypothetical protein